ncbi:dGTPase [Roseivirga spongicola]|uniref:dGTPase n=1 Tax=Roseivirga spongicola TaxID=333140 RepID=A0A150X4G6_9BACT|nr:dNTP triphosphohydrolase [Roseivirga spongicola]KYG73610.1 dGTPase [Roseivirga spongicola]
MDWNKYLNSQRLRSTEREKKGDSRNEFESDFGRVIFSPATRRMHDKTQVFPLTLDDNIHSRLTHSMEVMAIGHSLGLRVVEDKLFLHKTNLKKQDIHRNIPVILKNACLVHDIGNPPFGHFGESVIANYFERFFNNNKEDKFHISNRIELSKLEKEDFTNFDGNAQGFRVLTKLQVLNDAHGLNLTYGTLGAFLKYPNSGQIDKKYLATKKRGVFQSEADVLKKIIDNCDLKSADEFKRHPLAFLMEAADSICYLVMDIEDGFNKGWYGFDDVKKILVGIPKVKKKIKDLDKTSGLGSEITKMVKLRIFLISELVKIAVYNFVNHLEGICEGEYNKELIDDDPNGLSDILREFVGVNVFPKREIQQLELTGHSIITGLLDFYIEFIFSESKHYRKRAIGMISGSLIRAALFENGFKKRSDFDSLPDYYKLRVIVDFISGMTDQFALQHYQKLSGQKIS